MDIIEILAQVNAPYFGIYARDRQTMKESEKSHVQETLSVLNKLCKEPPFIHLIIIVGELNNRLTDGRGVKTYVLTQILKSLSNKKALPPLKEIPNSEEFIYHCEHYYVNGPILMRPTDEGGYESG
jgi:hypothetical protein